LSLDVRERDVRSDIDDGVVPYPGMSIRVGFLTGDLAQILAPLGDLPVVSDSLKSAPGKKGTGGFSNAKMFFGEVLAQFRVVPVITHQIDERRYGERRLLASREKRRKCIDGAVRRNKGRRGKALPDKDGDKGKLLCGCEGDGGSTGEGDASAALFSESDVED
jgi:hypothetical protein